MKDHTRDRRLLRAPRRLRGLLLLAPLLLLIPLTAGCLTTLAISAVAGSGGDNEHVEKVKETARDVAEQVRDTADDIALSAHDAVRSITDTSD